ncbi:MAG TPA: S8 family serine peptidase [Acidimicrobiales bacterium]|nr:S8 family serine peptidase [Acidimicrobiales bacterium]
MRFRSVSLALAGAALVATGAPPAAAVSVSVPATAIVTPGLAQQLRGDLTEPAVAFVHFRSGSAAQRSKVLDAAGLETVMAMPEINTTAVTGTLGAIAALKTSPLVDHLQENTKLEYFDDTADWATRTRQLQLPLGGGPYRDGAGNILDGTGIGIGIVDSGVDASHPDLSNRVATNVRFACVPFITTANPPDGCYPTQAAITMPSGTNSDLLSGHGTTVTGMAVGDGSASSGYFKGTAPGAKAHVFAAGAGGHVLYAVQALSYLHRNFTSFSPAIRVVNNSYGGAGPYDPLDPVSLWANKLVADRDVVITFAAGNDGGDGSTPLTSSYCRNPTPGIICVANYDEANTGTRNGDLDVTSSRGLAGEATQKSWPDISAPGAFVTTTCGRLSGVLCDSVGFVLPSGAHEPHYGDASGTSLSAPLVAGAVALVRQAKPSLTAAQVEDVLKDTAHKFVFGAGYVTDVNDAGRTTSSDKGAGLLDLVAAVNDARVGAPGDNVAATPVTIASGDGGDTVFGANDIVSVAAAPGASGVTYTITVRDATNRSPVLVPTVSVRQQINGVTYTATASLTSATTATATGAATVASIAGNVVTLFAPYTKLGNPAVGDAAYNVFATSYLGVVQDAAPGPQPGLALDSLLRPQAVHFAVR